MYWLLDEGVQEQIRTTIDQLVRQLSEIAGNPQADQLFPYIGRKDRRKANAVVQLLAPEGGLMVDPFAGSGVFAYSAISQGRRCAATEWEPYTNRMANAPFRFPAPDLIDDVFAQLLSVIEEDLNSLYRTTCPCGFEHVLDSQFFDRDPLAYREVTEHERLGPNGETITYRLNHKCPECGRTEKHFDDQDEENLRNVESIPIPEAYVSLFNTPLIENSRINLSSEFLRYGLLFPHRSKLALCRLWDGINSLTCTENVKLFLQDAFLSILHQAKFKDYRSKSQDLHVPRVKLREVNLLYRFATQVQKRKQGLSAYSFSSEDSDLPIACEDFRTLLCGLDSGRADLVFTDPPWTDGNAYFEKAQLYHPWLDYSLSDDPDRLENEVVITDAPSRRDVHSRERWWQDIEDVFSESERTLVALGYLTLFFRPIPASSWLRVLNRLKLVARRSGFEPIFGVDVGSSDPSMRVQQSARYVFSRDVIFVFVKIPEETRRFYVEDHDIDQYVFEAAQLVQERLGGPFLPNEWRDELARVLSEHAMEQLNAPRYEEKLHGLLLRYCDNMGEGRYLTKPLTPFSNQLFDIPAIERLFTYVPSVINGLLRESDTFTYDSFLLRLAEYVENGTRKLINEVEHVNMRALVERYAEPLEDGLSFRRRSLPTLPEGLRSVLELTPYEFETFTGHLLEAQGFSSVVVIGRPDDRGVDVTAVDADGKSTVVQCKRYLYSKVGAEAVQRLHSFAVTRGAERKILIATSGFTRAAIEEAANTQTERINGEQLENLVAEYMPDYFDN